jgi:hypothetical protein
MGTLVYVTAELIAEKLGFESNVDDDPAKVVHSWSFTVDGQACAVWDYKGSHLHDTFSFFGPKHVFVELFGQDRVETFS